MISVCMATYNGQKYIKEQIDSILDQLGDNDELIVSDDGSTDNTVAILLSYQDNRIKVYQNTGSHGVNANFSNSLRHANGEYIFLADQDDVWMPDKIRVCLDALEVNDCIVHDAIVVDENLDVISPSFSQAHNSKAGFINNLVRNSYLGCCMAFRRKVLDKCLPVPNTTSFFHDNWIGSIADLKYNLEFIPYKGILFRRHKENTSFTAKKSKYTRFQQLKNRLCQLVLVVKRVYM